MAHQTTIARWLFANKETFDFRINEFQWGKSLSKSLYDFEASITLNGQVHLGRGTDTNELLALEKACAEAIERLVCWSHRIATDGIAIHKSKELARLSSRREAVERFLLKWHQDNNAPFEIYKNIDVYKRLVREVSKSAKIQIGVMSSESATVALVCLIADEDQLFLGMSCEATSHQACEKAVMEALRNLAAFKNDSASFLEELLVNQDLWCGRAENLRPLAALFTENKGAIRSNIPEVVSQSVSHTVVSALSGCPVFVERSWIRES